MDTNVQDLVAVGCSQVPSSTTTKMTPSSARTRRLGALAPLLLTGCITATHAQQAQQQQDVLKPNADGAATITAYEIDLSRVDGQVYGSILTAVPGAETVLNLTYSADQRLLWAEGQQTTLTLHPTPAPGEQGPGHTIRHFQDITETYTFDPEAAPTTHANYQDITKSCSNVMAAGVYRDKKGRPIETFWTEQMMMACTGTGTMSVVETRSGGSPEVAATTTTLVDKTVTVEEWFTPLSDALKEYAVPITVTAGWEYVRGWTGKVSDEGEDEVDNLPEGKGRKNGGGGSGGGGGGEEESSTTTQTTSTSTGGAAGGPMMPRMTGSPVNLGVVAGVGAAFLVGAAGL